MAHQLLLTVADDLYRQAVALAEQRQQPVESVLVETLHGALAAWPRHPQREQMEREEATFEALQEALRTTYPGQFVALYQGEVLDHDADEVALLQRMRQRLPEASVLIRAVDTDTPRVLYIRSTPFVRDP